MSSRYYVSRHGSGSWGGVCEVPDDDPKTYFHHVAWPHLSTFRHKFVDITIQEITHPVSGWWDQMVDPDLLVDEGL